MVRLVLLALVFVALLVEVVVVMWLLALGVIVKVVLVANAALVVVAFPLEGRPHRVRTRTRKRVCRQFRTSRVCFFGKEFS